MLRYLVAVGALGLGGVYAASLYMRPVGTPTADPQQIAQLASRIEPIEQPLPLMLAAPAPRRRAVAPAPSAPVTRMRAVESAPAPQVSKPTAPPPPAVPEVSSAVAGVKQIALMGVTQQGDEITAWLVDLATQTREEAEAGDRAFGFEVKDVAADSVVLAQGGEEFTIRLGEKEIPVAAPVEQPAASTLAANTMGFGRGQRGDRSSRNAYRGYGGGGGSRSWGGSGNQSGYSNRGNGSGRRSTGGGNGGRASFGVPGGFSGGSSNRGARGSQSYLQPSSNPQEARRRGVSFIGEGDPLPQPVQIQNPQTQRRRGTATGPAFGTGTGSTQTRTQRRR